MFETLYTRAPALERHRNAPLLEERLGSCKAYCRKVAPGGRREEDDQCRQDGVVINPSGSV